MKDHQKWLHEVTNLEFQNRQRDGQCKSFGIFVNSTGDLAFGPSLQVCCPKNCDSPRCRSKDICTRPVASQGGRFQHQWGLWKLSLLLDSKVCQRAVSEAPIGGK